MKAPWNVPVFVEGYAFGQVARISSELLELHVAPADLENVLLAIGAECLRRVNESRKKEGNDGNEEASTEG